MILSTERAEAYLVEMRNHQKRAMRTRRLEPETLMIPAQVKMIKRKMKPGCLILPSSFVISLIKQEITMSTRLVLILTRSRGVPTAFTKNRTF